MVDAQSMKIRYYKSNPSWGKTIYVIGLPRSGKSTIFNVIGSCGYVEALEEPFELLSIAQKGSCYLPDSSIYESYLDSYMAAMENSFSELVLGRIYNFRENDKSCIYNIKSPEHVVNAHNISRRSDFLNYVRKTCHAFLIAFNDVEQAIKLITSNVPEPRIVHVKRNYHEIAGEIADKGWLTDDQLSTQANLTPAYKLVIRIMDKNIYVPYLISEENVDLFLSLDNYNRSLMYAFLQDNALEKALKDYQKPVIKILYNDLMSCPNAVIGKLLADLSLEPTQLTKKNIQSIKQIRREGDDIAAFNVHVSLMQYISNYNLGE